MTPASASAPEIPDWLPVGSSPSPGADDALTPATPLDYLEFYKARGMVPILLGRGRPWMSLRTRKWAGKMPLSLWHYFFPFLSSHARLNRRPELLARCNLGVRTGTRSHLVVIDIDDRESGKALIREYRLPPTLVTRTSGGFHLLYRVPESRPHIPSTHDCVAHGIDVRGEYAYCTVPPSEHGTGRRYEFVNPGHPIAVLPEAAAARFCACGVSRYWHVRKQIRNLRFLHRQMLRDFFRTVILRKPPVET